MASIQKPICGSDVDDAFYDFPLHVAAVFIVFAASIGGAGFPVVAKKVQWMNIPPRVFFVCKHFGTGVLIATAFVHLVPTAFASLTNPCLPDLLIVQYPAMPGVIMMGSLFILFTINMLLNAKTGGHSHGSATGHEFAGGSPQPRTALAPPLRRQQSFDSEKTMALQDNFRKEAGWFVNTMPSPRAEELEARSEMPPWFIVFYEQYVRQRDEMLIQMNRALPPTYAAEKSQTALSVQPATPDEDDMEAAVDPALLRRLSLQITLIEGGILFHSIFVGMTVSITADGFITLLLAIIFHQAFEGLGLGSRIAAVPYPSRSWKPWTLVVAFGSTAPIGQIIGLATRASYDPNSAFGLILVGACNAISSGLLIYASLVDLLAEDFLSEEAGRIMSGKDKAAAFGCVLAGAAGMSIVGGFA